MITFNRILAVLPLLAAASLFAASCGDDSDSGPVVTMTPDEFYTELERINGTAAGEISRIDSQLQGPARLQEAAGVYEQLADEVDALEPPVATAVIDQALVLTAREIAEELRALADSGATSSETLESYMGDYEFVCDNFVDVANATIGGTNLDCRFGFELID